MTLCLSIPHPKDGEFAKDNRFGLLGCRYGLFIAWFSADVRMMTADPTGDRLDPGPGSPPASIPLDQQGRADR
jgi:hypothetical protein